MDLMYLHDGNETKIGPDYIYKYPVIAVPYLTIISAATFLGTIGNTLVIGAVCTSKVLKTTGNMFIVNLAIADLCVTAFVDPFSIIGIIKGEVWFDDKPVLCEAVASICLTSCFCSLLNIGAISFNRYVHICHNQLYKNMYTFRNTFTMCVCLWIASFLFELPNFVGWGDHVYDRKTLSCVWDRTADFSYTLFFSTVGVAFPVILISICYARIFMHVHASRVKVANSGGSGGSNTRQGKVAKESMKLARTLFIIFVVFAVCWSPYAVIVVADINNTYAQELHIFSILLAHTNSSLNFVLYGLTNRHFRVGYIRFLRLKKVMNPACYKRMMRLANPAVAMSGTTSDTENTNPTIVTVAK